MIAIFTSYEYPNKFWTNRLVMLLMVLVLVSNSLIAMSEDEIVERYIEDYRLIAISEMHLNGIPASIKLAQAVLESNAGRSYLAVNANNHFGIKCGKYWQGATVMREDDDYENGKLIKSCFRAYKDAQESFIAHSEFLLDPAKQYRYGFLFLIPPDDYINWAKGLQSAGYATNPKYAKILIDLIQRYHLDQYDHSTLAQVMVYDAQKQDRTNQSGSDIVTKNIEGVEQTTRSDADAGVDQSTSVRPKSFDGVARSYEVQDFNGIPSIVTTYGDRLQSIALELGLDKSDLVKYNDFIYDANQELPSGTRIFIKKKKSKYKGSNDYHRTLPNQTAEEIAQLYGMRVDKLRKRNRWSAQYQPKTGERVVLRGKKKR